MHQQIMQFSSDEFYAGTLVAHSSVADRTLAEISTVPAEPLFQLPIEFIDTAGAGYDEEAEADGQSLKNPREAELVVCKVKQLLAAGIAPEEIAAISPYAAQVRHLERLGADLGWKSTRSMDFKGGRRKSSCCL